MKFAAVTLLCATLAIASPAPAAQPEAVAVAAPVAQPEAVAEPIAVADAVEARVAEPEPELDARADGVLIEARKSKTSKVKGGKGGNGTDEGAASMMSASRILQVGAVGLGVIEVVRLWG